MIRIVKPAAPAVLLTRGSDAARELCDAYQSAPDDYKSGAVTFDFDRSIYAHKEVESALRNAQHKKCAFCESFILHVSYANVEHFRPKAGYRQKSSGELKRPGYYWLAYDWENLFFSCQLCNQQFKKSYFPLKDGRSRARSHKHDLRKEKPLLIDPFALDPAEFIEFRAERAHAIRACEEGKRTIEILGLNRPALIETRGKRLQDINIRLQYRQLLREMADTNPSTHWSEELRQVERWLQESEEPTSEYSAMARFAR